MKCPVCKDAKLAIAERQGIEIDYCHECRGVWLDRGTPGFWIVERMAGLPCADCGATRTAVHGCLKCAPGETRERTGRQYADLGPLRLPGTSNNVIFH